MRTYRRVLAAIAMDRRGEAVARQAWTLARDHDAAFALAHVVDYGRGFEADAVPFLTPAEVEAKLEPIVRQRLAALAAQIGARDAAIKVVFGQPEDALPDLALAWQPDLVVTGRHAAHGLQDGKPLVVRDRFAALTCDTLVLPAQRPPRLLAWGWAARLLRA